MCSENGTHFQTKNLLKCFKRTEKIPNKIIYCSSQKQEEKVSMVATAQGIRQQRVRHLASGGALKYLNLWVKDSQFSTRPNFNLITDFLTTKQHNIHASRAIHWPPQGTCPQIGPFLHFTMPLDTCKIPKAKENICSHPCFYALGFYEPMLLLIFNNNYIIMVGFRVNEVLF